MNQPLKPIDMQTAKRTGTPGRIWLGVAVLAALAGSGYMLYDPNVESTDNAYVNGPVVSVVAQVSGPVAKLNVADNQQVNKGDVLLQIDPRPFQIALDQAQAALALARQAVNQQMAQVQAAQAEVEQKRSDLAQAKSDAARVHQLAPKGYLPQETIEKADTGVSKAQAELQAAESKLLEAQVKLGRPGDENESIKSAQTAVEAAQLKLEYSRIVAPFSGKVSNLNLQPGSMVQASLPLFALIGDDQVWVDANFKETQLQRVQAGQKAEVRVDMYPNRIFHGHVQSISGGSGTAFSLLPPQNATGNWVKITQRVPVKVMIDDSDPALPLRIGTSADVKLFL